MFRFVCQSVFCIKPFSPLPQCNFLKVCVQFVLEVSQYAQWLVVTQNDIIYIIIAT